ncbi:MAG: acetyl-CoA carboxylase biotin carboxyl carrier protein [Phycisphaerae bacterium]|nr:acetyl-CoA carboxylase biotin carboxyl carrier protein [Phycisphaerae bacterium]
MIDLKVLKQLIRLMKENDLSELDLRDSDEQVSLKRGSGVVYPAVPVPPTPAPAAVPVESPAGGGDEEPIDEGLVQIKSPMVGTFYAAASPDADPFVGVGASVGPDSVVCVVEAMKVFNEIKAELAGTVEKVLVSNGEAVEFEQPLFLIRPG